MKVRRLDKNHDWTFGASSYAQKSEAIAQRVTTALLSFKKNWFLDELHGVNWWAYFVKNPNVANMESEIKRTVLGINGVYTLDDLKLELDTETRKIIITISYTDIYNTQNTVVQDVANNG